MVNPFVFVCKLLLFFKTLNTPPMWFRWSCVCLSKCWAHWNIVTFLHVHCDERTKKNSCCKKDIFGILYPKANFINLIVLEWSYAHLLSSSHSSLETYSLPFVLQSTLFVSEKFNFRNIQDKALIFRRRQIEDSFWTKESFSFSSPTNMQTSPSPHTAPILSLLHWLHTDFHQVNFKQGKWTLKLFCALSNLTF